MKVISKVELRYIELLRCWVLGVQGQGQERVVQGEIGYTKTTVSPNEIFKPLHNRY